MRVLTVLSAFLFGCTAWSQEDPSREGPYIGVAAGAFHWDQGASVGSFTDTAPIVKLYGGFRFNQTWAVEGSYSNTSALRDENFGFPLTADFEIIEVRGLANFGSFFAGIGYWDADFVESRPFFPSAPLRRKDSGFSIVLGGQWSLKDRWDLRLEYELFDLEQDSPKDMSALSVGAHYKFGKR